MRPLAPLLLLAFLGCVRAAPGPSGSPEGAQAPDAGPTPAQRLEAEVDRVDAEVGAVLAATDEALWRSWTTGAPLDLAKAPAGHEALFTPATLALLRRAQAEGVAARRAVLLEQWLLNALLSRVLVPEGQAVASFETSASFPLGGREVPWRDLPRLLATERSAVKRRALWAASLPVAERLGALLANREERAAAALGELGAPPPPVLRARSREVDLQALAVTARELLEATDGRWRATLAELSRTGLQLPVEALTRADLPRLLKAPPEVDAAFPREAVGPAALATLSGLGLDGGGPTLALGEAAGKAALPLTVAPTPAAVRLSFRPAGGLRDEALLLSELGAALALSLAATPYTATNRLGDPARVGVLAALLGGLACDQAWLAARGVPEARRAAVVRHARALELYALRRDAAAVLLHAGTAGLPEAEARPQAVKELGQALGVKSTPADGARLQLELDDGLRSASQLRAALAAAVLRQRLGDGWWSTGAAGPALRATFGPGAAQPLDALFGPPSAGLEATLRHLGVTPSE